MKLEKINDNQIRCTLTKDDLTNRKINLNELSYGSEKARNLFMDMMQQANLQFGFESNGSPLMIEAIPTSNSLILNITKVNDPEELDTRFSSFSSAPVSSNTEPHIPGADGILNLLKKIKEISGAVSETAEKAETKEAADNNEAEGKPVNLIEAFRFSTLDNAIAAAKAVRSHVTGTNALYKYSSDAYILVIHSDTQEPESFNRICNILSEYGLCDRCTDGAENHMKEHGYIMIPENAIQKLSEL